MSGCAASCRGRTRLQHREPSGQEGVKLARSADPEKLGAKFPLRAAAIINYFKSLCGKFRCIDTGYLFRPNGELEGSHQGIFRPGSGDPAFLFKPSDLAPEVIAHPRYYRGLSFRHPPNGSLTRANLSALSPAYLIGANKKPDTGPRASSRRHHGWGQPCIRLAGEPVWRRNECTLRQRCEILFEQFC